MAEGNRIIGKNSIAIGATVTDAINGKANTTEVFFALLIKLTGRVFVLFFSHLKTDNYWIKRA